MNRKLLLASGALLTWLTMSACAAHGSYYARVPPPPPPRLVVGFAPGPGYVWCDGYYDWRGGGWYWVAGRWSYPPWPRAVWAPGYWRPHGRHGYRFYPGRWRR
ncbi:MAG: YXWGXW repeat-containing protein [Candidatus Solibacter usitatus]|nr:YXWGXW repeat-containing protein [Candidatus Solibacter usitatus]